MPDDRDDTESESPVEPEGEPSIPEETTPSGESEGEETIASTGVESSSSNRRTAPENPIETETPSDRRVADYETPAPTEQPIRWYLTSGNGLVIASRDIVTSLLAVAVIGMVLFAISGVWPPLVAIESGSMEPNMEKGDLVFLVENDRYPSSAADDAGIVTTSAGESTGHDSFGNPGNVIVYRPDGTRGGTPIIHRAVFHVESGEDWYDKTDPEFVGTTDSCASLRYCRAEHAGYITRGDANSQYDQVGFNPQSQIVKEEWIQGKAVARIPWLGCVRLELTGGPSCF